MALSHGFSQSPDWTLPETWTSPMEPDDQIPDEQIRERARDIGTDIIGLKVMTCSSGSWLSGS